MKTKEIFLVRYWAQNTCHEPYEEILSVNLQAAKAKANREMRKRFGNDPTCGCSVTPKKNFDEEKQIC